jgi:hypothetical protein
MGNYVIAVRKYVIVSLSELGNYMIADTAGHDTAGHTPPSPAEMLRADLLLRLSP